MEEKLIELVKENTFLYDKTSSSYKNIYLREKKFEEFSTKLNIPATKLKSRRRTLRDKFFREIKKHPSSGSGNLTPEKPWKWMEQMMFLKDISHTNPSTSGNFPREEFATESDDRTELENWNSIIEIENIEFDVDDQFLGPSTSSAAVEKSRRRKKLDDIILGAQKELSEVTNLAKEIFATRQNRKTPSDSFFECLAKQANDANLSPLKLAELQREMLKTFNKVVHNLE